MKKAIIISAIILLSAAVVYFAVCAILTFVPMIKANQQNEINSVQGKEPTKTIQLESGAKLNYFPAAAYKQKYVIVCPGGAYTTLATVVEGSAVAAEFNKLGYTAFVLEYRVGKSITSYQAPLDDLAEAIKYVDDNSDELNVAAKEYVLCGFSAGGNLIGLFGTEKFGYKNYDGIAKPALLVMGYPWSNPNAKGQGNLVKTITYAALNHRGAKAFLGNASNPDDMRVPLWVTEDYPRTYIAHGENDCVVPIATHTDELCAVFQEYGVKYRLKRCKNYPHGAGIGVGTDAEGFIKEAMDYLEASVTDNLYEVTPTDINDFIERSDGYMCGVCHSYYYYDEVAAVGAEWVRLDLSAKPYKDDGTYTDEYISVKQYAKSYVDRGFKVMLVTPYPYQYIQAGWDPRTEEGLAHIVKASRFVMEDMRGIVSAIQVTNELTEYRFRNPLTIQEAARFIGAQLLTLYPYRDEVLLGYNLSATDFTMLLNEMKPYSAYCDYVGIDVYIGCFESTSGAVGMDLAKAWSDLVALNSLNRPIVFTEFGYMSKGERKTSAEKLEILQDLGAIGNTFEEAELYAKLHIDDILASENFPYLLRDMINAYPTAEERANALFGDSITSVSYASHLYGELVEGVEVKGYPHNEDGQADFFSDFFDKMMQWDNVCGIFVYCLQDEILCGYCGQIDCPVETGWGLYSINNEPDDLNSFDFYAYYTGQLKLDLIEKPVVEVVREGFEKLKGKYND